MTSHPTNTPPRPDHPQRAWLPGPRHIGDVLDELRPLWVMPPERVIDPRPDRALLDTNHQIPSAGIRRGNRTEYDA